MWLFTRYGFYSIVSATKPDGKRDNETFMVRARRVAHLTALQTRFPALGEYPILTWAGHDCRYRLIVPKAVWTDIESELVTEQDWSNFKNEVASFQGASGSDYTHAVHRVWDIMGFKREHQDGPVVEC
jgi:hypothetical protein